MQDRKIAVVVDYLNQYGGAEKVLEAILEIFPELTVYTSIYDHSRFASDSPIRKVNVRDVLGFRGFNPLRVVVSLFPKHLTFVLPFFFGRLNLSDYDLIISSGTIWSKGVKTNPRQRHVFYCHTPPRFLYGYASESSKRDVWYYKPFVILLDHFLRIWDFNAARRPDFIVANSRNVQERIWKFYRRDSSVIYPPVEIRAQDSGLRTQNHGGYFLIVSRLSAYKNIDVAVRAFNELKLNLKIVGAGREERNLKNLAGPTVEFLDFVDGGKLSDLYRNCRAFINTTTDEDFGITPLEANSFGKPVIAFRSGGLAETTVEGKTGIFFDDLTEESLRSAIERFTRLPPDFWNKDFIIENAGRFGRERFKKEFRQFIKEKIWERER